MLWSRVELVLSVLSLLGFFAAVAGFVWCLGAGFLLAPWPAWGLLFGGGVMVALHQAVEERLMELANGE